MTTFTLLYTNIIPLIGEYEKYRNYDTTESIYIAHWVRVIALESKFYTNLKSSYYIELTAEDDLKDISFLANIQKIYLTDYNLSNFKKEVNNNENFDRGFKEYIEYLGKTEDAKKTKNNGYYRIIISYKTSEGTSRYGNIELYKGSV